MRILHVVTLKSDSGAYGGPTRVAQNQGYALAEAGHEVTLIASTDGRIGVERVSGVTVRLFGARRLIPGSFGFAGLSSPGMLRWLATNLRSFDVVHIHLARDLVTLPAALAAILRRVPIVVQTHGMVDESDRQLAKLIDAVGTRKVLRSASKVLYLTPVERESLRVVAGDNLSLCELANGVPADSSPSGDWTMNNEVLFLARLHTRKRPVEFVQMAHALLDRGLEASFHLVGPDEGEGSRVRHAIETAGISGSVKWDGPISPELVADRLRRAALYVLPAENEPYPMAVLEALSVGVPVVVTDSCGLAPLIVQQHCGVVVRTNQQLELEEAVFDLMSDRLKLSEMSDNAIEASRTCFGMGPVVNRLSEVYRQARRSREIC